MPNTSLESQDATSPSEMIHFDDDDEDLLDIYELLSSDDENHYRTLLEYLEDRKLHFQNALDAEEDTSSTARDYQTCMEAFELALDIVSQIRTSMKQ